MIQCEQNKQLNQQFYLEKQMSQDPRNYRIQTLEPGKLSQSMKSGNDNLKINPSVSYQTYYNSEVRTFNNNQDITKKNITKTQQIYESSEQQLVNRGFKKQKAGHIDKLNELKKQYQILRNIKIQDSVIYSRKNSKPAQSSVQPSEKSEHSVSHKSFRSATKQKNQQGLLQYQKKQLQLMLANSMNKVQELLRSEVQYKRKIYELTRLNPENPNQKFQQMVKGFQSKQKGNLQIIQKLKNQQQKLRRANFNLSQKIRSVQSELFNLETENRRALDQKRRLDQMLLLEKEGHMGTKIQVKRFQLEKDMAEKQKNNEIQRFKRLQKDYQNEKQSLLRKIRSLEEQIRDLNQKLTKQQNTSQLSDIIKVQKNEKKSDLNDQFQLKLAQKIKQLQNTEQQQFKKQIDNLRQQMQLMRSRNLDTNDRLGLQKRINALQKMINQDNEQKMAFLQELKTIIKDFQDLESQNQQMKQKLKRTQNQLKVFKQNSAYQIQRLSKSQRQSNIASANQEDINNYLTKIRKLEGENKDLKSKMSRFEDSASQESSRVEEIVRQYTRKLQQSQLQVQKLLKQNQFNLQIAAAKYKAEIQLTRNDYTRIVKEKNEEKAIFESKRVFLQGKVDSLKKQYEQLINSYIQKLRQKDIQIQNIKGFSDQNLAKIRQQYQKQLFMLLARLDQLIISNQRYVNQNMRLMNYQGQLYDLRQRVRRLTGLTQGVDHLWQVKQTEYYNINMLLKQMKQQ